MPGLTTPALVLRHANYREADRMVTLFTPQHGRIDAVAHGCRRTKSQLLGASEPFTSGDFELIQRGERFSIARCTITEGFYDLRTDYDRLLHGSYYLKLLEAAVMPDVPQEELFLITLRALAYLSYSELEKELVTFAYEMHFLRCFGLLSPMDRCKKCGVLIEGDARFDGELGGCVCLACKSVAPRIGNGARRILHKLPRTRFDQVALLSEGHDEWKEAACRIRAYIDEQIGAGRYAPPLPQ